MTELKVILLENTLEVHREYIQTRGHKENTCGPYLLAIILRALGYRYYKGIPITEDLVAKIARTRVRVENIHAREQTCAKIVLGELTVQKALEKHWRVLYKYELEVAYSDREVGISIIGLIKACEEFSNGELTVIPIPSRRGKEKRKGSVLHGGEV